MKTNKKKLFLYCVLLKSFLLFSAQASEQNEDIVFVDQINKLTKIPLICNKLTANVSGFRISSFSEPEQNRNHYDDRNNNPIKSIVMHYTVCDLPETLNLFTKDVSEGRVSATYVISETENDHNISAGKIIQVVPDEKRAWHAGVSQWRELKNLNAHSLGIENVNKGFVDHQNERQWFEFDPIQIHSLGLLSQDLVKKYNISPAYVVGHADICPNVKTDPRILFPWKKLYEEYNVGAWLNEAEQNPLNIQQLYSPEEPLPQGVSLAFLSKYLKKYGYKIEESDDLDEHFENVMKAFKGHFSQNGNPNNYNGRPDEKDMLWIWGLVAKYKNLS